MCEEEKNILILNRPQKRKGYKSKEIRLDI